MQSLDEFKVRNYTKRVLALQRARQEYQIQASYGAQDDKQNEEQNDKGDHSDYSESEEEEEVKAKLDSQQQERPTLVPVPDNFNFENKVETALQKFIEAEHFNNMLMPTINGQAATLKEVDFKAYISQDKLYETHYGRDDNDTTLGGFGNNIQEESKRNATQLGRNKAPILHPTPTSLMLMEDHYDSRIEKLDLCEKDKRKVYIKTETGYELQDMYRINDNTEEFGREQMINNRRATYKDVTTNKGYRVYLYPQVYAQRVFEETIGRVDVGQNASKLKDYLRVFINFFKSNPYAAAKLFHGIATDSFYFNNEDTSNDKEWKQHYKYAEETHTKKDWGDFLPDRVRQMLLNMSRYFFDDILAADSKDPILANEKFFAAFKVFVQNCTTHELFESVDPLRIHWHFLQVIKVLFDGQTRSIVAQSALRKIFKPVYEKVSISTLRKKLLQVTDTNSMFLRPSLQQQSSFDNIENVVDELRSKLFDQNSNYSFSQKEQNQRNRSTNVSDLDQLYLKPEKEQDNKKIDFHSTTMPQSISQNMFKSVSRVMPEPALVYEKNLLEPLTSIFAEFQSEYNEQIESGESLKSVPLPDCKEFTFEVVNTNMLMTDIYAPKGLINYEFNRDEEQNQPRPEEGAEEFKLIMTNKVIEICSNIIDSLKMHRTDIPFSLRLMIRLLLNHGKQNSEAPININEAPIIADFLAGSWLSNAFRWPECLGMEPSFKEEALTLGHILTACRLVLETTLACSELPYPTIGHCTYNITKLNKFIKSQVQPVLKLYNQIFQSVDVNQIKVQSFDEARKQNPTKPTPPREIFEASLMRFQDMATLLKLVQWQFEDNWSLISDFEWHFQIDKDSKFMMKDNEPALLRKRVEALLQYKKNKFLEWWSKNDYENLNKYQEIYGKQTEPFSFELQWPFINYEYKTALQSEQHELLNFFLKGLGGLQGSLFRVYKQQDQGKQRASLKFKDEIFQEQFMTLYDRQKNENFTNQIKSEKKSNQKKQFEAFVCQYFDPTSNHERLREAPTKAHILSNYQSKSKKYNRGGTDLTTILEIGSESSFVDESFMDGESDKLNDSELECITEYDDTESSISVLETFQDSGHLGNAMSQSARIDEDQYSFRNVRQSSDEERKIQTSSSQKFSGSIPQDIINDKETQIKMQYVDAISRVFFHLRGALNEPNFHTERSIQRLYIMRDPSDIDGDEFSLNLEDLFKNVLEHDRNQPDESMQLQLDAFLIKRYFSRLQDKTMQDKLMGLMKQRLTFITKMMDINFEKQNYKLDRVCKFIAKLNTVNKKRTLLYGNIFQQLKVNRFIYKKWGTQIVLTTEDINQMIRQVYINEVQEMRNMHHQTEIFNNSNSSQQKPQEVLNLSSRRSAVSNKRQQSVGDSMKGVRQSSSSVIVDFIEEAAQLDQIQFQAHDSLAKSLDRGFASMHNSQSPNTNHKRSMTGSVLQIQEQQVTLDINVVSSNLIYVATVLNSEFIKNQIKETNLEDLFIRTQISLIDDNFLIYDLYKIYLFCVQKVLKEHKTGNQETDERHFKFLMEIQAVFFQQLIQRVWDQLKQDPEMLERDSLIREYFRSSEVVQASAIERDMDLLDLSSSEDEEEESKDTKKEDTLIYGMAIQTLLSINQTNHMQQKAEIIEKSVLMAVRAYERSNLLSRQQKTSMSSDTLNRILNYVIGECYKSDDSFSLHLNLTFIIMILNKSQAGPPSIQSVSQYLGNLCQTINDKTTPANQFEKNYDDTYIIDLS